MTTLKLDIVGNSNALDTLSVNGKFVKIIKNKDKTRTCVTQIEGDKAELVVYKSHYYNGKHWFWWNLLYFIVSIFGLFDIRQDKKFLVIEYKCIIDVSTDTNATLRVSDFENGGKFLDVEVDANVEEVVNKQYFDKDAKIKHKKMKKAKIGVFVAVVAIIAIITLMLVV